METETVILITVIGNLLLQPIIQYLLHSRCSKVRCCFGLVDLERSVLDDQNDEIEKV